MYTKIGICFYNSTNNNTAQRGLSLDDEDKNAPLHNAGVRRNTDNEYHDSGVNYTQLPTVIIPW
jgi:hypothetical protein